MYSTKDVMGSYLAGLNDVNFKKDQERMLGGLSGTQYAINTHKYQQMLVVLLIKGTMLLSL